MAAAEEDFLRYLPALTEEISKSLGESRGRICHIGISRRARELKALRAGYLEAMNGLVSLRLKKGGALGRRKRGELLCDRALEIIRERYHEQALSIASVSAEIFISPNYLSSLIKKSTGRTFVEILTACRMKRARELLLGSSMKICEITEECGYKDQHYFSYCFKKMNGMSPNQLRKREEL